jgi:hypothetical protein
MQLQPLDVIWVGIQAKDFLSAILQMLPARLVLQIVPMLSLSRSAPSYAMLARGVGNKPDSVAVTLV